MPYFILLLLCCSTVGLKAQSDCTGIEDPLFSYDPDEETDLCCGVEYMRYCYDLGPYENAHGPISPTTPYRFQGMTINGTYYQAIGINGVEVTSYAELVDAMQALNSQININDVFVANPEDNTICIYTMDNSFGFLNMCYSSPTCIAPNGASTSIRLLPMYSENECPISPPDFTGIFDPNSSVEDLTIFNGTGGEFTTQDLLDGGTSDDPYAANGPSVETSALILNGVIESGLFNYATGCFSNLNCISLGDLANNLNNQEVIDYIDDNYEGEDLPDDWETELSAQTQAVLEDIEANDGGLVGLLNTTLGFQIPITDEDCPDGPEKGRQNSNKSAEDQTGNGQNLPSISTVDETEADASFFDQVIPGLGLEGPGTSQPSPSALEMIKQVQAQVDLYNGQQNTTIPLHTVTANGIEIPISLSSSNNGIKVNDIGSTVGQNWNLNAGGMISRVVKGLPDEYHGTVYGNGVGRNYKITPRIQIPSTVGVGVDFIGSGAIPITPEQGVETGVNIANTEGNQNMNTPAAGDNGSNADAGPIKFSVKWTPLRPNLVQFIIGIPVFKFWGITVYVEFAFSAGVTLNEKLGPIAFEEESFGFIHPNNALTNPPSIANLSSQEKIDVLSQTYAEKGIEDSKFLNNKISVWAEWAEAIEALIEGERVYETTKHDTEPDEFYFNFGEYSGKFMFNKDGEPVVYPEMDLTIEKKMGPTGKHLASFIVTTPEGMQYTFGRSSLYGVDMTRNTNYHLPNFYTYDEKSTSRDQFGNALIDEASYTHLPFIGLRKVITYGNTYERNYRVMESPAYTSTWHLTSVKSLISQERVRLSYDRKENLSYYSDKSYTHTLPNFGVNAQGNLTTQSNGDLHPIHLSTSRWLSGRAEFAYNATETTIDRWDLTKIATGRGEEVTFHYKEERGEIVGDYLLDTIKVHRNGDFYKGWLLDYSINEAPLSVVNCDDEWTFEPEEPMVSISEDTEFNLGEKYDLKWFELKHHWYLFFHIRVGTWTLPLRFPIGYLAPKIDAGYRTKMTAFGSLMEVKLLNGILDPEKEAKILQAESQRSFLREVKELDQEYFEGGIHDFVEVYYKGTSLPKRFHYNQDLFGYYNDNEATQSVFPSLHYTAFDGTEVNVNNHPALKQHFGFYKEGQEANFYLGQDETPVKERAQLGAISKLEFASGAKVEYDYELNAIPSGNEGAGVRVSELKEDPGGGMPVKITTYEYGKPAVINEPVRISQNVENRFYSELEQKVVATSMLQNELYANKGGYVGYQNVTEHIAGMGSIKHYFSAPIAYGAYTSVYGEYGLGELYDENQISTSLYERERRGINCFLSVFNCDEINDKNLVDLPTTLDYPRYKPWLLGVAYRTEVKNGDDLIQVSENYFDAYEIVDASGTANTTQYFKAEMYQTFHPGSYEAQFFARTITQFLPFVGDTFGSDSFSNLVNFIVQLWNLTAGIVIPHPYRMIERDYVISERSLSTGNLRLDNNHTTDIYGNGSQNVVEKRYTYNGLSPRIPKTITTLYADDVFPNGTIFESVLQQNFFIGENTPEFAYFSDEAMDHLSSINYNQALVSRTSRQGTVIGNDFTALDILEDDNIIVPLTNWTYRDGSLQLAGKFSNYNADGKPQEYRIAKYNATPNASDDLFFPPIELGWNEQLQLTSRTYGNFSTTYDYNNFFELITTTNPDGIVSEFTYDLRGRLASSINLNGRQETTYDYVISEDENSTTTELVFTDGLPTQTTKQFTDGIGRPLQTLRVNDGAILKETNYDVLGRIISSTTLGNGTTTIEHEQSLIPRTNTTTDAAGNTTSVVHSGNGSSGGIKYFTTAKLTDPNDHISNSYVDALGRKVLDVSGAGSRTSYEYDPLGRLVLVKNPIGENYAYNYNEIDQVELKLVPTSFPSKYWYNEDFRLAATKDANGNYLFYDYDIYGRVTHVYSYEDGVTFPGNASMVHSDQMASYFNESNLVQQNTYQAGHTWLEQMQERIFSENGSDAFKSTNYTQIDEIGQIEFSVEDYPAGSVSIDMTYNNAGLMTQSDATYSGSGSFTANHEYYFDDLLRLEDSYLDINNTGSRLQSRLDYNNKDQVETKWLAEVMGGGFLQEINYAYDGAGKLLQINGDVMSECFEGEEICELEAQVKIFTKTSGQCQYLSSIQIDGETYEVNPSLDLLNQQSTTLADEVSNALSELGYSGEVSQEDILFSGGVKFVINITNTNVGTVSLHFENCTNPVVFVEQDCCTATIDPTVDGATSGNNPDLYYQTMTYDGLDISQIQLGSGCQANKMVNDYSYDANHRITSMANTFFNPDATNAYSTTYSYDLAGNIKTLTRNGLIETTADEMIFGNIDNLKYSYTKSRLNSVLDNVANPDAQPKGFKPTSSNYSYDAAGNLKSDSGKNLTFKYNVLNLPQLITSPDGLMKSDYTFGGQKIRKEVTGENGSIRDYTGSAEFKDGAPEVYHHEDGRIFFDEDEIHWQYTINDHLGNTVVVFEDKNEDGIILTESSTDNPLFLEVLQRNLYYPFGMNLEGGWNQMAEPGMKYQYNGKELNDELGLDWFDYGARYYDAAIGRFSSIDPLVDAPLNIGTSPYAYVWNNPLIFIDPDGMHGVSHHLGENGEVIGSIKDGDDRTYIHADGTTLDQIKAYNETTGGTSGGGSLIGSGGKYQLDFRPNRDYNQGDPRDPLHANSARALTVDEFAERYDGSSLVDIKYEGTELVESESGGFNARYVTDPKTGYVIDMKHFLKAGEHSKFLGDFIEWTQRNAHPNSAYHPQDLYSNALGIKFFNAHRTKNVSVGIYSAKALDFPGGFTSALASWLKNR
ncbi:MAG: RHS repeat-associated core domain-containing protein [Bacteroidota bacterium]